MLEAERKVKIIRYDVNEPEPESDVITKCGAYSGSLLACAVILILQLFLKLMKLPRYAAKVLLRTYRE